MHEITGNSWVLEDEERWHLFCRCGDYRTIEPCEETMQVPECERCGSWFIDVWEFMEETDIRYRSPFVWEWRVEATSDSWTVSAVVPIPLDIEKGRPIYRDFPIARIMLSRAGDLEMERLEPHLLDAKIITEKGIQGPQGPKIFRELHHYLLSWLAITPVPEVEWLFNDEHWRSFPSDRRLYVVSFFLRNPHLRELDFFFWIDWDALHGSIPKFETVLESVSWILAGRKEKRVRRAFFETYKRAMQRECYSVFPDRVFARTIGDPNHLEKLIRLSPEVKSRLFSALAWEEALEFSRWIIDLYGERGAVRFYRSVEPFHLSNRYIRDIHRLMRVMHRNDQMRERFARPSAHVEALHDRLAEAAGGSQREWEWAIEFEYPREVLRYEGEYDGWSFRLPKTGRELAEWGRDLRNCLASYISRVDKGECIVLGIFRNDKIKYALEIVEGEVVQLSGKGNTSPPEKIKKLVKKYINN